MGDPECQTILPILKTELLDIIIACCNGKLEEVNIEWNNKKVFVLLFAQKVILKISKKC